MIRSHFAGALAIAALAAGPAFADPPDATAPAKPLCSSLKKDNAGKRVAKSRDCIADSSASPLASDILAENVSPSLGADPSPSSNRGVTLGNTESRGSVVVNPGLGKSSSGTVETQ